MTKHPIAKKIKLIGESLFTWFIYAKTRPTATNIKKIQLAAINNLLITSMS